MAARKKRRKAATDGPKPGRKKELKRFELNVLSADNMGDTTQWKAGSNEIAFVIATSGGSPLNQSDTNKLSRLIQHTLRSWGHKLKRKGQPLDPPEPKAEETPTPDSENKPPREGETDPVNSGSFPVAEASSADGDLGGYIPPQIADLSDPDDPHPNNP